MRMGSVCLASATRQGMTESLGQASQHRAGAEQVVRAPARAHLVGVAAVWEALPLVAVLDEDRPARLVEQLRI